jgi:hypothetical protein
MSVIICVKNNVVTMSLNDADNRPAWRTFDLSPRGACFKLSVTIDEQIFLAKSFIPDPECTCQDCIDGVKLLTLDFPQGKSCN